MLTFGVRPTFALLVRVTLAPFQAPSAAWWTTTSPPRTFSPPIVRSIRTWVAPDLSTITSRTANASAALALSPARLSPMAALARATAAAGVGWGAAVGAPVAVVAEVSPRAVVVATAVAAANRADLFILALLQEASRGPHAPGTKCTYVTARLPHVARVCEKLPFRRNADVSSVPGG